MGARRAAAPAGNRLAAVGRAHQFGAARLQGRKRDGVGRGAGAAAQGRRIADHGDHAIGICRHAAHVLRALGFTGFGQKGRDIGL